MGDRAENGAARTSKGTIFAGRSKSWRGLTPFTVVGRPSPEALAGPGIDALR